MGLTDQIGSVTEEITCLCDAKYLASVARGVLVDFYFSLKDEGHLLGCVPSIVYHAVLLYFLDVDAVCY